MGAMVAIESRKRVLGDGLLYLEVGYFDPPDARTAGQVIERLGNAFTQGMRREAGQPAQVDLEVTRIEIASLRAWFDISGVVLDLYEQRELLGRFVQALVAAVQSIGSSNAVEIPASIRTFLTTVAGPIVNEKASHAKVEVRGDNNIVLYIERADALTIDTVLAAQRRARSGGNAGPSRLVLPHERDEAFERSVKQRYPASRMHMTVAREIDFDQSLPSASDHDDDGDLEARRRDATLMSVGGEWYARPEGMNGILLPVIGGRDIVPRLKSSDTPVVTGVVIYAGGSPQTFSLD